jgi:hypothetical protein
MKSSRHPTTSRRYSAVIQRGGRVALPPDITSFHLGQRVYFYARDGQIGFQLRPKSTVRGRFFSSRVRRVTRSLAAHGPRVRPPVRRSVRR